jgi:hypothetical protein
MGIDASGSSVAIVQDFVKSHGQPFDAQFEIYSISEYLLSPHSLRYLEAGRVVAGFCVDTEWCGQPQEYFP